MPQVLPHALLLDDFGTGYSGLKLDRSSLADLDRPAARTIVQATVEMAHQLGLQIVAEGVETAAVLETVRALGCDGVQGFLLHRPAAAEHVSSASSPTRPRALRRSEHLVATGS